MGTISTAVGLERRARGSGYKIVKFFTDETGNLPQRIAIFGEANTANQSGLSVTPKEITSAKEAGEEYGFGSPIYAIMNILRPPNGDGVGGIPTVVFPQVAAVGASATTKTWSVTGTATANATHFVLVNGRDNVNFTSYAINIVIGDTADDVAGKIADAINGVLGSPCTAAATDDDVVFTTKWKGTTSAELKIVFDFGNNPAGLSYSQSASVAGAGSVDLAASLSLFAMDWFTIVINPYGAAQFATLEQFNGFPDPVAPTGQYSGMIFRPFIALFGSTLTDKDAIAAITDASARVNQVTNALAPAPASDGFPWEAAANMAAIFARVAQDSPHRDVNDLAYPDMPVPADKNIGDMMDYNNRDFLLKKGASTVILENGAYRVQDFVTTYHPEGETPLLFASCRDLMVDFNFKDMYYTYERIYLRDKTIVRDDQNVSVKGVIKPKEWKAKVFDLYDDCAGIALINDPEYSKANTFVQVSPSNPRRFETRVRYKRTSIASIQSTDAEVTFGL